MSEIFFRALSLLFFIGFFFTSCEDAVLDEMTNDFNSLENQNSEIQNKTIFDDDLDFKDISGKWSGNFTKYDVIDSSRNCSFLIEFKIRISELADTIPDSKEDSLMFVGEGLGTKPSYNFKVNGTVHANDSVKLRITYLYFFYGIVSKDGKKLIGEIKNKPECNAGCPLTEYGPVPIPGSVEKDYIKEAVFEKISDDFF